MAQEENNFDVLAEITKAFEEPSTPSFEMDLTENIPEPQYLLQIGNVPTLPMGDISCVGGKAKAGKSYLTSIFASALLAGDSMNIKALVNDAMVCLYDSEQHRRNVARVCRRIHHLCGWDEHSNNPRFKAFTLRTSEPDERLRFITESIKKEKPQLAIIDGIADVVRDFNNLEESSKCVNLLMELSAENNCCILCVLHQNQKSRDNQALRGHLGTSVTNKSSDIFTIERNDSKFTVKHEISRNRVSNDWCFTLDPNGIPVSMGAPLTKEQCEATEIQDKLTKALNDVPLRYKDLVSKYVILKPCSERTAKRHIALAIEHDFITETNGLYELRAKVPG